MVSKAFEKHPTNPPLFNCETNQNSSIALYSWDLTLKQLLKLATNANLYTTLVAMHVSEGSGPRSGSRNKPCADNVHL